MLKASCDICVYDCKNHKICNRYIFNSTKKEYTDAALKTYKKIESELISLLNSKNNIVDVVLSLRGLPSWKKLIIFRLSRENENIFSEVAEEGIHFVLNYGYRLNILSY